MRFLAIAALSLPVVGCATFEAADNVSQGSPRFFAGTRLDAAAISQDSKALEHFDSYGMQAPACPHVDMPLSFLADIVLFPIALGYSVTEPLLYVP